MAVEAPPAVAEPVVAARRPSGARRADNARSWALGIWSAAKAAGALVVEAFMYRHHPAVKTFEELLAEGECDCCCGSIEKGCVFFVKAPHTLEGYPEARVQSTRPVGHLHAGVAHRDLPVRNLPVEEPCSIVKGESHPTAPEYRRQGDPGMVR